MGFSLADIVRILEVYDDRDQLEQFFSARQRELEAISQDTAHKLTKPCGREFLLTEHILQRFPVINCNHRRGIGYDPGFFQFSQFPVK